MTLDALNLHALDRGPSSAADARAAIGPVPVKSELDTFMPRLLSADRHAPADDGGWCFQRRDAITDQWWPLTVARVADRLAGMRPGALTPLTADQVAAVHAALVAELERRHTAPARVAPVLTLAAALARPLTRTHEVWADRDGRLWWRPRPADPVLTGGPYDEAPTPPGRWSRRQVRPAGAAECTPHAVAEYAARVGLLARHEVAPPWEDVVTELRVLVGAPEPSTRPRPGSWLRGRSSTTP